MWGATVQSLGGDATDNHCSHREARSRRRRRIALACGWRVLARDAYLYVPEVKIGLNLQWGALPRLISLVGPARAKRITIMCEKMGADQALSWGLVDELAGAGQAVEKALE